MRPFLNLLIGLFCIIGFIFSALVIAILVIIGGILIWIIPTKAWRRWLMPWVLELPVIWSSMNNFFLRLPKHHQWIIQTDDTLKKDQWYILIANHQSWLDIPILGLAFNRKIPLLKFFMKKELLWSLPLAGVAAWMIGYPFMRRHSHKEIRKQPSLKKQDIETTKKACQKFKEFPTTVMNFTEGTRFSPEKAKRQHSPFLHLLKPKAGGIALVINELRDHLDGIINVTIHYSKPDISFFKFFLGDPCQITVRYEKIAITPNLIGDYYDNREFRISFQQWLNAVWHEKDVLLGQLNENNIKTHHHHQS